MNVDVCSVCVCVRAAHLLRLYTAAVVGADQRGGCQDVLAGGKRGRRLDEGRRVAERAESPLLRQELLVGHWVDWVGERERGTRGERERESVDTWPHSINPQLNAARQRTLIIREIFCKRVRECVVHIVCVHRMCARAHRMCART